MSTVKEYAKCSCLIKWYKVCVMKIKWHPGVQCRAWDLDAHCYVHTLIQQENENASISPQQGFPIAFLCITYYKTNLIITYIDNVPILTGAHWWHCNLQLLRTFTITKYTSATDALSQADVTCSSRTHTNQNCVGKRWVLSAHLILWWWPVVAHVLGVIKKQNTKNKPARSQTMQPSHHTECICQCTAAYTEWSPSSAGARDKTNNCVLTCDARYLPTGSHVTPLTSPECPFNTATCSVSKTSCISHVSTWRQWDLGHLSTQGRDGSAGKERDLVQYLFCVQHSMLGSGHVSVRSVSMRSGSFINTGARKSSW